MSVIGRKGWRKTSNKGMEEERWKCGMKGMEEMRNCMMDVQGGKCERNEGMEEDLLIMEEERWKWMMYEWNGGDEELYERVQKEVCDEQIKGGGR